MAIPVKSKVKVMKKLILTASSISLIFLIGCTTEYYESVIPGPQGLPGPQGPAGEAAFVFEYTEVNFFAPDYEVVLEYPSDFEGLNSDVALAYLLWDVQEINGELVDVWRPLPQQVFAPFGTIQYNYDFTPYDIRLFMEGTFSADQLSPIDTEDWVVRVVIVPGNFWNGGRVTYPEYQEVIQQFGYLEPFITREGQVQRRD